MTELPCGHRIVRDSKDPAGPALRFTAPQWPAFTADSGPMNSTEAEGAGADSHLRTRGYAPGWSGARNAASASGRRRRPAALLTSPSGMPTHRA
jgi:Domain of unknown function (DUF397)